MSKKFKAEPGMQMAGIVVRIGPEAGEPAGGEDGKGPKKAVPKRASGFNPVFSPEMYRKRNGEGVTGFEAKYPPPTPDNLALLVGIQFNDIFAEPEP